ncbi:MAG TPA: MlaD family protein [Solirubrobacteraceae bacterium]|nr:MlaD family protein [Solirubrobacteraceae bacterium]
MSKRNEGFRRGIAAALVAACVLALVAVVLLSTSAGGSGGEYRLRAIFDDAGNLTVGEQVTIDGVDVGKVQSVEPTPHAQAAVVMKIENPGFQDFREDASCTIRPQALIGEKFVDCLPTQPRVEGTPPPPPLKTIPSGQEGAGQVLLPVTRTHSPVDQDLLGDIARLPERERLTILINELGAGFAGRGNDLNVALHRANPALEGLERVLGILAKENKVLTDLAVEGDRSTAPLAADRERLVGFVNSSAKVAQASANHRGQIAQGLAAFPAFLEQLGPAMERLGRFADQTTPTFTDLGVAAPGLNKTFESFGPFSKSSEAFFKSFGENARRSSAALRAVEPLLPLIKGFGKQAKPAATNLSALLAGPNGLKNTGGLERLLDFIYLGAGSVNGYDALGHFLRAEIVASSACLTYAIEPSNKCSGRFTGTKVASAKASAGSTSLVMLRTLAVLKGMTPAQAIAKYPDPTHPSETTGTAGAPPSGSAPVAQPVGGAAAGTTYYTPEESSEASGLLLNYLLGN